jgi:hypothetical protein
MPSFASLSSLAWLRTLVWVLVLALPLQAQARIAMLGCSTSSSLTASQGQAQAHDHQAMLAQMSHAAAATADSAAPLDETTDHVDPAKHSCSACAVCCLGAALPCGAWHLALPTEPSVFAASPEPASLAVVTATLERPPRALLQR